MLEAKPDGLPYEPFNGQMMFAVSSVLTWLHRLVFGIGHRRPAWWWAALAELTNAVGLVPGLVNGHRA